MTQQPGQSRLPIPPGAIVVGGQWGSEGKGSLIYEMGKDYQTHVRVGGPQAGHSIKLPSGDVLKFQCIPVGAVHGAEAIIGMQSVVDVEVLYRELEWLRGMGIMPKVIIDSAATVLLEHHVEAERVAGLRPGIGSTGKGVGAARADRIMRRGTTIGDWLTDPPEGVQIRPGTADLILDRLNRPGHGVLVEAAQGVLLSLFSSGYYPYVTSCEATPTGAFAEMGLPLRAARQFESVGVFRTFPIRVAGNSGPLPDEITWEILEQERGTPIDEQEKLTTVTRATRRVARWNHNLARFAVQAYGLDWAALTFLDYVFPEVAGEVSYSRLPAHVKRYVTRREQDLGIPIHVVGTGFGSYAWRV